LHGRHREGAAPEPPEARPAARADHGREPDRDGAREADRRRREGADETARGCDHGPPPTLRASRPRLARLIDSYWILFLVGWAAAAALLFALYLLQRRTGDATAVDAGWAGSLVVIVVVYAILGPGRVEHRALIAVMAGLEYARIAGLVLRRIGHGED